MPPDSKIIALNGWKQFSALDQNFLEYLKADRDKLVSSLTNEESRICLPPEIRQFGFVCSQSCDILTHNFKTEPAVEILFAERIENPNKMNKDLRSPRVLDLPALFNESEEGWLQFSHPSKKLTADRTLLTEYLPSSSPELKFSNKKILSRWLERRYSRPALPDDFNDQIGSKEIVKTLDKVSDDISEVLISLDENCKPPYEVKVLLIESDESKNKEERRERLEETVQSIDERLSRCSCVDQDSLEVGFSSQRQVTYENFRIFNTWDFEQVSVSSEANENTTPIAESTAGA